MLDFLILAPAAAAVDDIVDFAALDAAIEGCRREIAMPAFASEAERRSGFLTSVYQEQAAISAARASVADQRRALREAGLGAPAGKDGAASARTDQELALALLALDDRQRVLDDRRRLEAIRREAIDLKRTYFLSRCPTGKKAD
jgi:hypothetical protein